MSIKRKIFIVSWGVRDENEESFYEENDLRIYVKGKYLCKVIKWFETMQNREFSVDREFKEELIHTDILPYDFLLYTYPSPRDRG